MKTVVKHVTPYRSRDKNSRLSGINAGVPVPHCKCGTMHVCVDDCNTRLQGKENQAEIHAIHHNNIHCASRALPCSYTSGKLVQSMEPATMSITVVRDWTPCGVVHRNQHFYGTCCLLLRGRKVRVLSCTV